MENNIYLPRASLLAILLLLLDMRTISLFSFVDLTSVRSDDSRKRQYQKLMLEELDPTFTPYKRIRPGISKFLRDGFDMAVIEYTLEHNVLPWNPETKRAKAEKENSLLALRNILSMPFPSLPGVRFEHRPSYIFKIGGLSLKVSYDAFLSFRDKDGKNHLGAIKAKIKKDGFMHEDAEMAACLMYKALQQQYPDAIVERNLCLCFNPFTKRMVGANNIDLNYAKALAIARLLSGTGDVAA